MQDFISSLLQFFKGNQIFKNFCDIFQCELPKSCFILGHHLNILWKGSMNQLERIYELGVDKRQQFVMFTPVIRCGLETPVRFSGMVWIAPWMCVYAHVCTHEDICYQERQKGRGAPRHWKIHGPRVGMMRKFGMFGWKENFFLAKGERRLTL